MNLEKLPAYGAIRLALGLVGCALCASATAAPVQLTEAWLTVESLDVLRGVEAAHPLIVDHGRKPLPGGRMAVRVMLEEDTLGALQNDGFTLERIGSPRAEDSGAYSTPEQGHARLRGWVEAAPRAGVVQLGESSEGRPILAAWFGQPPSSGVPQLRVLGAHHGDEWSSFEVALAVAELLGAEDGTRPDITALLDDRTVWVAPYINPDGVLYRARQNAQNVDLNRNYDFEWSGNAWMSGDAPFSAPETRAVRAHALTTTPPISLSLHSGATNIGYVWNYSLSSVPDRPAIEALADRYADATTTEGFWVTNGAAWYRTWGDTNDWSYGRYGGMDFTIELTLEKRPPSAEIPVYVAHHREAVIAFLTADLGVSGQVVDAESDRPIPAVLTVAGTPGGRPFLTDPQGRFARAADPSGAQIEVSASGYATQLVDAGDSIISLDRQALSVDLPIPGIVTEDTLVELADASEGAAELSQPGHPPHTVDVAGGRFRTPDLAGGAWTVTDSAGSVYPRVLLSEDPGPAIRTASTQSEDTFRLTGTGLAEGSRVWALVGEERAFVEIEVQSWTQRGLTADATGLLDGSDFLTLSNGTWLAHTGRTEHPEPRDTGLPPDSGIGPTDSGGETVRGNCGCATGSPLAGLFGLAPLVALRRRRT